jgi:hypothetical protein
MTAPQKPEPETKRKPNANMADRTSPRTERSDTELSEAELDKAVGGYTINRPPTPTPPPPPQPPA